MQFICMRQDNAKCQNKNSQALPEHGLSLKATLHKGFSLTEPKRWLCRSCALGNYQGGKEGLAPNTKGEKAVWVNHDSRWKTLKNGPIQSTFIQA